MSSNSLEQLKATGTTIVTDTGEFEQIAKYKPQDATTNPSLILAATKNPEYASVIDVAIEYAKDKGSSPKEKAEIALDRLLIEFGKTSWTLFQVEFLLKLMPDYLLIKKLLSRKL